MRSDFRSSRKKSQRVAKPTRTFSIEKKRRSRVAEPICRSLGGYPSRPARTGYNEPTRETVDNPQPADLPLSPEENLSQQPVPPLSLQERCRVKSHLTQ